MQHRHPRQPELVSQPVDGGRDHPEILRDQLQLAELTADDVEEGPSRAMPPVAGERRLVARRHRPVGDEAAEVVDARGVDELEGAAEALDPPAVARLAQQPPVVERIAPELPGRAPRVGRHAGDRVLLEELGVREVIRTLGSDVDRQVADQAHAPLRPVGAQGAPLALETHLGGERPVTCERGPVAGPVGMAGDEAVDLTRRDRRLGVGEQALPAGEGRGGPVGGALLVRGAERQDLPPGLAGGGQPVDEAVGLRAEAAAGEGGGMEQDAARP